MVDNYEGLTAEDKVNVVEISYKNAEAYLEITKNNAEDTDTKELKSKK